MTESSRAVPDCIFRHLPRLARGVAGLGTLVLKRSRGLACGAADCPVGDVWPGGSETGGAKMSDASKSFAED